MNRSTKRLKIIRHVYLHTYIHIHINTDVVTRLVAFFCMCHEYKMESSSESFVETMPREQEENKGRVRFVERRENRPSKKARDTEKRIACWRR